MAKQTPKQKRKTAAKKVVSRSQERYGEHWDGPFAAALDTEVFGGEIGSYKDKALQCAEEAVRKVGVKNAQYLWVLPLRVYGGLRPYEYTCEGPCLRPLAKKWAEKKSRRKLPADS